jgi:hypothetical protein
MSASSGSAYVAAASQRQGRRAALWRRKGEKTWAQVIVDGRERGGLSIVFA